MFSHKIVFFRVSKRETQLSQWHALIGDYCAFTNKLNKARPRPCDVLSNGIPHMQIHAGVLDILLFETECLYQAKNVLNSLQNV